MDEGSRSNAQYREAGGFRRHFSAHTAIIYLRRQCLEQGINWIIDADIRKFFDTISWNQLQAILQKRVNDGALLRLIGKWLHVGVLEDGQVVNQELGTPQGAPISPILANIFLHYVLEAGPSSARPKANG